MKISTHQNESVVVSADTPETELIQRAANGDSAAFEVLMRRHNQLLFRTARSILKDDAEAEDVLQDAYLRIWHSLGDFRAQSKLSTWMVRIVINEGLGRLRRRSANIIPLEAAMVSPDAHIQAALTDAPDHGPEQVALRAQIRDMLEMRIDLLPEVYRTVFMLRAVEELSVEDVAQALSIPEATVRTRFFRARGLLREGLAREVDVTLGDTFKFDGSRCDRIVANVMARISANAPG